MSLKKFLRNLKVLWKNDLRHVYCKDNIADVIEQAIYEVDSIKKPNIKDYNDTIKVLLETNSSIARFGDGEIAIIEGKGIPFQEYNVKLSKKLKEVLTNPCDNLLVGINYEYYYPRINELTPSVAEFYRYDVPLLRRNLSKYINFDFQYYAAAFTQLYMLFKSYDFDKYYNQVRKIWDNKKITIICGDRIFNDIEYNIFDNASNVEYMHIPSKNAYSDYDNILANAKKIDKDRLLILIAGPTAKPLVYDLTIHGRRALDLGHIAKDYNAYKRSISIDTKAVKKFFAPD